MMQFDSNFLSISNVILKEKVSNFYDVMSLAFFLISG